MEHNVESMVYVNKPNPFRRFWEFATSSNYRRTLGVIAILIIGTAIPLTAYIAQQQTQTKQHAAEQPLPDGGVTGSVKVYNARGDVALSSDGSETIAINSTNSLVQLLIKPPNGSTLGQVQKPSAIAYSPIKNIIPQAYAASLCSSPRRCAYYTPTGCTYAHDNQADTQCQNENPAQDNGDSTTASACYTCGGDGSAPTATPTQGGGGGSGVTPRCNYINATQVSYDPSNEGLVSKATIAYTGQPTTIEVWAASDEDINKTVPSSIGSWVKMGEYGNNNTTLQTVNLANVSLRAGLHTFMMVTKQGTTETDNGRVSPGSCATVLTVGSDTPQPTATPTPQAPGGGLIPTLTSPKNGTTVSSEAALDANGFGRVTLIWNHPNATSYNVRVQNNTNPLEGHPSAPFANNCTETNAPKYVCINGWTQKNITIAARPGDSYTWWLHAVDASGNVSNQSSSSSFTVSGNAPTVTTAPANPATQIIKIDIQNVGTPGTGETGNPVKSITDLAQLSRIFHGTEKVGWNLFLPDFTKELTTQTKEIKVTFTHVDGTTVITTQKVTYAPFVMRFDTLNTEIPSPRAGQKLYVFTYGSEPIPNVVITSPNGSIDTIPLPAGNPAPDGGVVSPVPCGSGTSSPTCAWKIPIPGEKIPTAGRYIITFRGGNPPADKVTEAVDVLPATGQPPTPTATLAPGVSTPTPTRNPSAPTATLVPGQPTVTPIPGVPTNTPVPGAPGQPTVTPTSVPLGGTTVSFSLVLTGIGPHPVPDKGILSRWNPNPTPATRDLTAYLYAPGADPTGDTTGSKAILVIQRANALAYNNNGKFVAQDFDLGPTFIPGDYQVLLKSPRYLRKRIPGTQTIHTGKNTTSQEVTLVVGDVNGDNKVTVEDYQAYRDCINNTSTDCVQRADLNSDGKTDRSAVLGAATDDFSDFTLLQEAFAHQEGD